MALVPSLALTKADLRAHGFVPPFPAPVDTGRQPRREKGSGKKGQNSILLEKPVTEKEYSSQIGKDYTIDSHYFVEEVFF
ncbi:MAG: hypothetical protein PHT34_00290 [Oscillospiraceae bacterium]|nr:hypothetical protein [Oscillospiraceae bacterium]